MPTTTTAVARALLGRTRTERELSHQQLPVWMAAPIVGVVLVSTPIYASDMLVGAAGPAGPAVLLAGTAAVVCLAALVLVVLRSAIETPHRTGAFGVVREHLGETAGTLAGAGLLAGLALTAALSALVAAAGLLPLLPELALHRGTLALALLAAATLAHLFGLRHPAVFGGAAYAFAGTLLLLVVVGGIRCALGGCPPATPGATAPGAGVGAVLPAFALGASLLVGVSTVAGGASVFRYPRRRNAARTLLMAGGLAAVLLVGVVLLAWGTQAHASEHGETPVLAVVAAAVLGTPGQWVVQLVAAAVLLTAILAVYADIPRLTAELSRDRLLPRQLQSRGDRLASFGVVLVVAGTAAAMVSLAGADTTALVAATVTVMASVLSMTCAGLALRHRHARRHRASAAASAAAAGCGAAALLALPVAARGGSWPALLLLPALAVAMARIRSHYTEVRQQLSRGVAEVRDHPPTHAVILLDRVDEAAARALSYVQATTPASVRALGVPLPGADVERRWAELAPDVPVEILQPANSRGVVTALVRALERISAEHGTEAFTTAVIPETLSQTWGDQLRKHRLALRLKRRLQHVPSLVVTDLTSPEGGPGPYTLEEPRTHHVIVLVAAVDAPTTRALAYARALQATSVRALSVNLGAQRSSALLDSWEDWSLDVPLLMVDSPLRSVSAAVRRHVRGLLPDGRQTIVTCVLPQIVPARPWQRALHNQTARLLRTALLFERGVVTASVPYALRDDDEAEADEEAARAEV